MITTHLNTEQVSRRQRRLAVKKHFHPLLEKEKQLHEKVHEILPKATAEQLCPKGSRLAHLYGLPKTHKERLCMRPILSASGTYNYPLAKWLDEKLKPLSTNKYCINDIFGFIDEIKNTSIEPNHILVSYDVSALFTNVPLKETIDILVDKAFEGDWFNKTHSMQLQKHQLTDLLEIATTNQLFQFNQPTQGCYSISKATLTADTRKAWSTRWLTVRTGYLPPKKVLQKNATSYAPCFQSCTIQKDWLIPT